MFKVPHWVSTAILIASACLTGSANAADPIKIATLGGWDVYRSTDSMTDKVSCFAAWTKHPNVQLIQKGVFVSLEGLGGVSSYRYRLDDGPSSNPIGTGPRFFLLSPGSDTTQQTLYQARRLRLQVDTLVSGVLEYDIDMTQSGPARELLAGSRCI